jgi:hypothetical protein
MTSSETPGDARPHPVLLSRPAPRRPINPTERLRARWWVYTVWYVFACLAASAFWAQDHGGGVSSLLRAFGYLLICSAALMAPGLIVARSGLSLRGQRSLLLAVLALTAALVAGTMSTGILWAPPPFILLLGNAVWSIEEIDRRLKGRK